jgi:thiol-disulfide isomerase/thioredoxin
VEVSRKLTVFAVVLALGALAAGVFVGWNRPITPADVNFTDVQGKRFTMSSLNGKVVLVNFWATSCTICVNEMPKIVRTFEKYRGLGLETVAVAMPYDPPDRVLAYAQQNNLPFRVTLDTLGNAVQAFGGVRGTPTTFLVSRSGTIVKRIEGELQFGQLTEILEKELAKR